MKIKVYNFGTAITNITSVCTTGNSNVCIRTDYFSLQTQNKHLNKCAQHNKVELTSAGVEAQTQAFPVVSLTC